MPTATRPQAVHNGVLSAYTAAIPDDAQSAFRALVIEHAPHLQRVLRGLGVPPADLDDVCQETFIVAHRRLPTFEGRSSLRTWLYGIALRVASDYRNKAYRRRERPTDSASIETRQPAEQDGALERRQAWQLLESLLAQLTPEQRQVFVLYEIAGFSMPEAANLLGWPLQTAYSRLNAARERVQRSSAVWRAKERSR